MFSWSFVDAIFVVRMWKHKAISPITRNVIQIFNLFSACIISRKYILANGDDKDVIWFEAKQIQNNIKKETQNRGKETNNKHDLSLVFLHMEFSNTGWVFRVHMKLWKVLK